MNKILFLLLILSAFQTVAQKRFSEGSIRFDVTMEATQGSSKSSASFIQMVKGSHYRSELSNSLGKTTTIFDIRDGVGGLLREYGTQKILIPMNSDQWESKIGRNSNLEFTIASETKQILGFTCQMATALMNDSSSLVVFFTNEIMPENKSMELQFVQLPGFVLEYTSLKKNLQVTYTVKSIDFEPVPVQKFEIPKSGFRILEYERSNK